MIICRNFGCHFHRNGVAGAPFWLVTFDALEGRTTTRLWAMIFDASETYALINPLDPESKWRGDNFASIVRHALALHSKETWGETDAWLQKLVPEDRGPITLSAYEGVIP